MTDAQFKEFGKHITAAFNVIKNETNFEVSQIGIKLSEAVMWSKASNDAQKIKDFKPEVEIRQKSKFYETDKSKN